MPLSVARQWPPHEIMPLGGNPRLRNYHLQLFVFLRSRSLAHLLLGFVFTTSVDPISSPLNCSRLQIGGDAGYCPPVQSVYSTTPQTKHYFLPERYLGVFFSGNNFLIKLTINFISCLLIRNNFC